tara:strand:- start:132 stop:923 length:792 start_codon:yes stop_codon:yes gene_type:complete
MKKSILASTPFLIINKVLLTALGVEASVVLSHLHQQQIYFKEKNQLKDGMFFCTTKNISCTSTLSYHQINKSIATLVKWEIVKVVRKGVPAKLHFKINESQILKILNTSNEKNSILDCENFYNKLLKDSTTINNNKEIILNNNNSISPKDKFLNDVKELEPKEFIEDFLDYWTEENSKGKMRWELERTWNTSLRYKRWVRLNAKFEKTTKTTEPKYPDYYDIHFAKRLEQDQTALRSYYKHLEGLGYEKKVNHYDGKIKWIKR